MTEPLWRRYLRLVRPDAARDVDEELEFHLAMRESEFIRAGAAPDEARRMAHERFGLMREARASCLAVDRRRLAALTRSQLFDALAYDIRHALRGMRQNLAFTAAVVATLGLGIGATTAIFSAVDAALLRPLPFAEPSRLLVLNGIQVPFAVDGHTAEDDPIPQFPQARALTDLFESVAAYAPGGLNLAGDGGEALRVSVAAVTPSFFPTLGVAPATGRAFSEDEGQIGAGNVAVISHGLWLRRYGRTSVVGRSIQLNGSSYQIVGVMPPGFVFPRETDVWLPLSVPTTFASFEAFRSYIPATTVARLRRDATAEAAAARLTVLWQQVPEHYREYTTEYALQPVKPLQAELAGERQKPLLILLTTTGLLLVIACTNVTSLLLARATTRRREVAMRAVLGASRARVVSQLLVESLLLALAGSLAGVVVAFASLGTMRALLPATMAAVAPPELDLRVLGFAVLLAIVTGLAFGLWPALGAARTDAAETIKSGGLGATGAGSARLRRLLMVGELAVALTLLTGSGLMLRSFQKLMNTDPGYRTTHVGTLELTFARATDRSTQQRRRAAVPAMLERLAAMPGVEYAGVVNDLPLRGGSGLLVTATPEGWSGGDKDRPFARYLQASAGYFGALGIPLLRGRLMTPLDTDSAPKTAVISATMAHRLWPGQDPIGKRLQDAVRDGAPTFRTIIGVVGDVREAKLEAEPELQMYYPVSEQPPQNMALVARGTVPVATLLGYLRAAVKDVDPAQPVYSVRAMDDVVFASLAPRRTNTLLISAFGALALLLAIMGVYGVVSYGVSRRTRELGIRAALGATALQLVGLVVREGALVAASGVALGLAGSWAFAHAMRSMLYNVAATDTLTFVAAPTLLFLLVLLATLGPARRAARLNPVEVIRQD